MTETGRAPTSHAETAATEPDAVRREIEETRRALGDTVDALADKVDVRSRASAKLARGKDRLRLQRARLAHRARRNQAALTGAVVVLLAGLGGYLAWRRRRDRR